MRPLRHTVVLFLASLFLASVPVLGMSVPADAAASPYGANSWSCKPSAAHPVPVVLVHGTGGDQKSFDTMSAWLTYFGFCTFALDYGGNGLGDIPTSAGQLSTFVDAVRTSTGAAKVSIIGHSQGGTMARYYAKFLGGAAKIDDLIGLAPSNHGVPMTPYIASVAPYCLACTQQVVGSIFLTTLNAGDETPGDVSYTNIATVYDQIVTPNSSSFLSGPNTTNVRVQDFCPYAAPDHGQMVSDLTGIQIALNALSHAGPATSFKAYC